MFMKSFWGIGLLIIVGATFLLTPETSEAQRRGGGRRGDGWNERREWRRDRYGGVWGYGYGLGYGTPGRGLPLG
jgi:hypothetical protein